MAKKDLPITENKDKDVIDKGSSSNNSPGNNLIELDEHIEVKNANASGLGSMGRNDEKLGEGEEKGEEGSY